MTISESIALYCTRLDQIRSSIDQLAQDFVKETGASLWHLVGEEIHQHVNGLLASHADFIALSEMRLAKGAAVVRDDQAHIWSLMDLFNQSRHSLFDSWREFPWVAGNVQHFLDSCVLTASEREKKEEIIYQRIDAMSELMCSLYSLCPSGFFGNTFVDVDDDTIYREALQFVMASGNTTCSGLQRHLQKILRVKMGYKRSEGILQRMENEGLLSSFDEELGRQILLVIDDAPAYLARTMS